MPWYYVAGQERVGPVSDADFAALQQSGKISPDTLVWQQGMADWVPLKTLGGDVEAAPAGAVAGTGDGTVVCAVCGGSFPASQVIRYEDQSVCAACKPLFFQKIKEGAATVGMRYAGFWIRFAAKFVDGLILGLVNGVLGLIIGVASGGAAASGAMGPVIALQLVSTLLQLAIGVTYHAWFIGKYAATPGKMACGLRVVLADGGVVSYRRGAGRYFAELLSSLILLIGYIMVAFDKEKRALHDHICSTRVIYK